MNFKDLLNEIDKCVNNKEYYAALTMSLIIPDICSIIAYDLDKASGKYYREWFDEYIGKKEDMLYQNSLTSKYKLTGKIIYELRNNVFHCGLPTNKKDENKVFYFEFNKSQTLYRSYTEFSGIEKITINVPYLCGLLYDAGKQFYENNKNKFPDENNWKDVKPNFLW